MKFKIMKGTPLFDKLREVGDKMKAANKEAYALCTELGFKQMRPESMVLAGGISSLYAKTKPEGYAFAFNPSKSPNDFFPKRNKANKEIIERIKALPKVEHEELNNPIKYDGWKSNKYNERGSGKHVSLHPGISWHKNFILISVAEYIDYKPVKDMIEITVTEYKKLEKEK